MAMVTASLVTVLNVIAVGAAVAAAAAIVVFLLSRDE
jgi:hypothetical protein